ncbi:hypothetical protein MTO96_048934 [Rhipicephalus appendiculatus]
MHALVSSKDFIMVDIACVNTVKSLQASSEVGLVTFGVAWAAVCEIKSNGAWTASLGTEVASILRGLFHFFSAVSSLDLLVVYGHLPIRDKNFPDCHMTPPTYMVKLNSSRYTFNLATAHESMRYLHGENLPESTRLGVSVTMFGRWYKPRYPTSLGNYSLMQPCGKFYSEQITSIAKACREKPYRRFHFDNVYRAPFSFNRQEEMLFTYDSVESLRSKLCEGKANLPEIPYVIAAFGIELEDWRDVCGFGAFFRLRFLKKLLNFLRHSDESPMDVTACNLLS